MRNHKFDNLRAFLLLCVVFGHFLELIGGEGSVFLYRTIYSFHIPALLFVSGYFARFRRGKILRLLGLYLVFQTLYQLFQWFVFPRGEGEVLRLQYTTPYWLLWYLLTLIFYLCLTPLFSGGSLKSCGVLVVLSVVISVGAGFVEEIGYPWSLSRTLVFLPFFGAGQFAARWKKEGGTTCRVSLRLLTGAVCLIGAALWTLLVTAPYGVLYGSFSYAATGTDWILRLGQIAAAFCWIGLLLLLTPNQTLPGITAAGQNTLTVFLVHGFLVRLANRYHLFRFSQPVNLALALASSLIILLVLGSPWLNGLWKRLRSIR